MRISDWSSDVCSSDLVWGGQGHHRHRVVWAGILRTAPTRAQASGGIGMRRPVPHSNTQTPATTPKRRCAVYTRKSTDEGLDMEYNSLEAQREDRKSIRLNSSH